MLSNIIQTGQDHMSGRNPLQACLIALSSKKLICILASQRCPHIFCHLIVHVGSPIYEGCVHDYHHVGFIHQGREALTLMGIVTTLFMLCLFGIYAEGSQAWLNMEMQPGE